MATRTKNTEQTEPVAETVAETAVEAPRKTRQAVPMVLSGAHEISAEVASDDDMLPGRAGGKRGSKLDDELQAVFDQHVSLSWERGDGKQGRWLTMNVPAEAEREAIKRLRYAATKAGMGLALGNVRPQPGNEDNVVRIPYQARVKKVYKPREK